MYEGIKFNKTNLLKWLNALRSGEYQQCRSLLASVDKSSVSHCCLGVLCEVARLPRIFSNEQEAFSFVNSDVSMPPREADKWLMELPVEYEETTSDTIWGLTITVCLTKPMRKRLNSNPNGYYPPSQKSIGLTELNDAGFSFEEIADIIEENFMKPEYLVEGS